MAYTPELSYENSSTLRRIAWAFNVPMTKAINTVFEIVIKNLDHEKICSSCRDKSRCETCNFNHKD